MSNCPARPRHVGLDEWVRELPRLFASNRTITADVSRAARQGLVRKLGPRLYTTNVRDRPEEIVGADPIGVASLRFPGAALSHRSAFELAPAEGYLFLTGTHERTDRLPGLTIRLVQGPGPQAGDMRVLELYRSSDPRAYLENLKPTRRAGKVSRVLRRTDIEARLERVLRLSGEQALNKIRDEARALVAVLDAQSAFETLDAIIGTLVRTRTTPLAAPTAVARSLGTPYDDARIRLFESLAAELTSGWSNTSRPVGALLREERQHLAFIDAYFSNYIEGTMFTIEEANAIVFEDEVPSERPADAHDVKGTFALLVDDTEMQVSMAEFDVFEDFENSLQRRHRTIMAARSERRPGLYKQKANRAGETYFVLPELVRGTLQRGFDIFQQLATPFQRACFVMFLVAEVHPFEDGNGRLARAMANAELTAGDQANMLIVTSYRTDYLGVLRRLSRQGEPTDCVRMLDRAQEFTARLSFKNLPELLATLQSCNAFDDTGRRILKLPPKAD